MVPGAVASGIDISVQELVPVVSAAGPWGKQWSGKHLCSHSDNMAIVSQQQDCQDSTIDALAVVLLDPSSVPTMPFTSQQSVPLG